MSETREAAARPRLELVALAKRFGRTEALRGAELAVHAGDIVGLCGDQGAGKSTLVEILAGVHPHGSYDGAVVVDGVAQRLRSPDHARRAGIAVVHQQSLLVPRLSVAHNLMLGREPRRFGLVDDARLEAEARDCLERFGVATELATARTVADLDAGSQHIVEILRALTPDARVLVIDERPATLGRAHRDRLFAWLRRLAADGMACLYVAQRMDELVGRCDQVLVLRDGRVAQRLGGAHATARGRYLVGDEIAAGGMATVHLGKSRGALGFSSTVAIKRLHASLARDAELVAMFVDEARLASRVRHPNVVPVLDVFADDGELGLVMEYVEGESLARLVQLAAAGGAYVPVPVAVAIVAGVLHGLHAAHEARDERGAPLELVHRDVSPRNVLVGTDGVARLCDFGVAKAIGRHTASRTGQLKGTIAYMAPEQIQGTGVDRRTDVYGAAVLLWELLAGERLFDGESEGLVLGRVLDDRVPTPSSLRPELPRALDAIALRGLDRTRARRFASAAEMAAALEAAVRPSGVDEVGAWVRTIAAPALAERAERLARLERAVSRRPAREAPGSRSGAAAIVG
jgi:ABC-type branched-subunit amino acid transport system ATPase component